MHQRQNIRWYAEVGANCFSRAAAQEKSSHKGRLLETLARRFEAWRQRYERLSRELRDRPYLLTRYCQVDEHSAGRPPIPS